VFDSNVEVTGFNGHGPIPWSLNRYNRGDFPCASRPETRWRPRQPEPGVHRVRGQLTGCAASQAWRPSPLFGSPSRRRARTDRLTGMMARARSSPRSPSQARLPARRTTCSTAACRREPRHQYRPRRHAWASPEANFSFSTAWFPYDQGWLGGEFAGPSAEGASSWTNPRAHAAGLSAGLLKWLDYPTGTGCTLAGGAQLPGVDALEDGMLFATSADAAAT